ncbi:MAG: hypothetical protein R3321_05330, partial [Nitrososphaeraceae archaeon]|nr:hypothetical protein [Nitrososphaeraceae archaeon]
DLPFSFNQKTTSIINNKGLVESTYGEDLGPSTIKLGVFGKQHRVDNKFIREVIGFKRYIKIVCRFYNLIDDNDLININIKTALMKLESLFYPCRFILEPKSNGLKLVKIKFTKASIAALNHLEIYNLNRETHDTKYLKMDPFSDEAIENYKVLNYRIIHKIVV